METNRSEQAGGISPVMRTTLIYLGVGAGLLLVGLLLQPRFKARELTAEMQEVLFPKLTEAAEAASLEIVAYDEELGTVKPFKVVKSGGVWVLPSHENYPADARDHLAAASTELIGLKVLKVVSKSPGDHETYGVIEPDLEKLEPGMTGVGQLVEIRDASGATLARLVVGKEDRQPAGAAGGNRKLRFVRRAGQDPVYRVEIDTSKFTTSFDDWIEKDLLQLSPWDVRKVRLENYTLSAVERGGELMVQQDRTSRIDLEYDDKDAAWSLDSLETFEPGQPDKGTPVELGEDEELDSPKLNDLRDALADLKIIDVARKPAGLSAELKAEASFLDDDAAVASMRQRGFLPLESGEILSTDGETVVGMKDGVEYLLRFGTAANVATGGQEEDDEEGGETSGRYLLVTVRLNESLLEKPKLEPLPDLAEEPAEDAAAEEPAEDAPAEESAAEKAAPEEASGEEAAAEETSEKGGAAEALKEADEAEAEAQAAREQRRRVERENRRRQDEYDEKVEAAQKRVRELNARFADWYYIVPEAEYDKIHLTRDDVIKSEPAEEPSKSEQAEQ